MKNKMNGMAAAVVSAVLAAGMLTGCGNAGKLDGSAVVASVDGEDLSMGLLSFYARQQQAYMESLYKQFFGSAQGIWDQETEEEGMTEGDRLVRDTLNDLEIMYAMKEHASEYSVELTQEDLDAAAKYAAQFIADNTEETLADLAVSEADIRKLFELQMYQKMMREPIRAGADTEVSDEEAQQSTFTYLRINLDELEEEEAETARSNAQTILDEFMKDPAADLDELAKAADDTLAAGVDSYSTNAGEDEDSDYPAEVMDALGTLKDGEVYGEVIEAEDALYVVRMDMVFDEDETESRKESIINERKNALYEEVTEGWKDAAEITENDKTLKKLKVDGSHTFTMITGEEEDFEMIEEDAEAEGEDMEIAEDAEAEEAAE